MQPIEKRTARDEAVGIFPEPVNIPSLGSSRNFGISRPVHDPDSCAGRVWRAGDGWDALGCGLRGERRSGTAWRTERYAPPSTTNCFGAVARGTRCAAAKKAIALWSEASTSGCV